MKKSIITFLVICLYQFSFSQNVGIGTSTPDESAVLHLQSIDQGLLLPRMGTTQRNFIANPATGLLVFDTDKGAIYMFDGIKWVPLSANSGTVMQTRTSNTPALNTGFGWTSCISGNYAVISSCKATGMGVGPWVDTAYVFSKTNGSWSFMTKLVQSDAVGGDGFGAAVAISGDYLLIGAPNRNNSTGAVYAFTRVGQTWNQTAILTAANLQAGSKFGSTISIGGSNALIGAPSFVSAGIARGTVYSFSRNVSVWSQVQQLFGISNLLGFGQSMDVSGAYAIIGAPESDYNGVDNAGLAYFFKLNGSLWTPTDTIYNTNAQIHDRFGFAVAINESTNWAFISRPGRATLNDNTGEVCTYTINAPGLTAQGILSNPLLFNSSFGNFGTCLSVYSNNLLVGVPEAYNENGAKGRVYLYQYDATDPNLLERWQPAKILKDENQLSQFYYWDTYGRSAYINGFDIVIGNPGANKFTGKVLFMNVE